MAPRSVVAFGVGKADEYLLQVRGGQATANCSAFTTG